MNYSGKFDAKISDALGHHPGAHLYSETVHGTHAPADAVVVSDAHLLFGADFKRAGVDLVLSGDGREVVLHDYFKGEHRAALASPDGAHLTGDIVTALAGEVQYAQADGNTDVHKVIGHVTKLVGTATAVRNGVSIVLNNGDNVEKGDVVSSGSDSTLGITFIDGTVFGLSANARMVLNEMVYDPNGSNNSSLLSLVAGTITFVAGETAKHGDMKVDTPVATMGIRGTAVLVEIDFSVPGAAPDAKFQVLVEPDGTTGSYILFDKTTLTPLAVVDHAGTQINISNGIMSQTLAPLSPEIQKLINDVFTLKFSDSSNTKSLDHFTDTIIPTDIFGPFKFAGLNNNAPTIPVIVNLVVGESSSSTTGISTKGHIADPPVFQQPIANATIGEQANKTGSASLDTAGGQIQYFDVNVTDHDTVSVKFTSFTYQNANGQNVTGTLNSLQLADIAKVEAAITVAEPFNLNGDGSATATWSYSVADKDFDFLAAGEKLTLTYTATVDNNYQPLDQASSQTFTITITGTNDAPVITSSQQNINFVPAGTDTKGGELVPDTATTGALTFTDPDLTDTHTAAVKMTSALLDGVNLSATVGQMVIDELGSALTAKIATGADSTGTGTGTIAWTLADLQVYLADVIPANETLVLTYAVTVTDSQGATSTQDIVVTIGGNQPAATVWIDTDPISADNGALWSTASNWESDRTPTSSDDVFIGTDQVLPNTPTFPVTVNADAQAKSLTMDYFTDFGTSIPELDVDSNVTLTIAGDLKLDTSTDSSSPLTAESIIKNWGTISVGGVANLLKHSVLDNYGTFYLAQGGEFADQSSITNSGIIEIASDTLDVTVDIVNSITTTTEGLAAEGAVGNAAKVTIEGTIQVDTGAKLLLSDGGGIIGGNLTIASGSTVEITYGQDGTALANGAILDGVTVTNDGTIQVDAAVTADPTTTPPTLATPAATLTLDDGTTIKGGNLTIADGAIVDIEAGATGPGATLDGVTVNGTGGDAPSTIEIGNSGAATLLLDDDTTITNGNLTIAGGSTLDVEAGATGHGATLDGVTVSGTGGDAPSTIEIGNSGAATLLLDDGTTITNGNLTIASGSTLDVEAGTTDPGATLDGVTVIGTNAGESTSASTIEVGVSGAATLLIDDGTTITNGNLTIADGSAVDVEAGTNGPGATLDGVAVEGTSGGSSSTIAVGEFGAATLTLDDGTTITNGNLTIAGGSTLDIESGNNGPGATLDGVTVSGADAANPVAASTIEVGNAGAATLTLDDGTTITNGNLTVAGGSIVDVESVDGATLDGVTVTGVSGDNASTIEVGSLATLLLDDGTTITNGNLTMAGGSTLDVEAATSGPGATLDGVTVTGTSGDSASTIEVGTLGPATLLLDDGTTIANGNLAILGGSTLDVESGTAGPGATLDGVTVHGTDAIDMIAASTIAVGNSGAAILTLEDGTSITNGNMTIAGGSTVDVEAGTTGPGATLDGVTVTGASGNKPSKIEIGATAMAAAILLLDDATSIIDANLTIAAGSTLDVESADGATLNGVNVTGVSGQSGSAIEIGATTASGSILTLEGGSVVSDGNLTIASHSTLDIESSSGATLDGVNVSNSGTIQVDPGSPGTTVTLVLEGGTEITDGQLVIHVPGSSEGVVEIKTGGATLNDVTVADNNKLVVDASATLTVEGGTKITGGIMTLGAGSVLDVETASGATLDGVNVTGTTGPSASTIEIGLDTTGGSTLILDDGTTIAGGDLTIAAASALDIEAGNTGHGATLDGVTVSGTSGESPSTIEVGASGAAILVLDDGTTIANGNLTIAGGSSLHVEFGKTGPGATLNGVTVNGTSGESASTIEVGTTSTGGTVLTLEGGTTVSHGDLKIDGGNTLDIESSSGATLDGVSVTNNGTIQVDGVAGSPEIVNLLLDGGTTITGGTLVINALENGIEGTVEIGTGGATFDAVTVTNNVLTIDQLATLTLNGSSISGGTIDISGTLDSEGASFITGATILNSDDIDIISGTLMVDPAMFTNVGTIDMEIGSTLVLFDETVTNSVTTGETTDDGLIQVDATGSTHFGTLDLEGSTINGGTINVAGVLDSTGDSFIDGATITNTGIIESTSGVLKIESSVLNNGTIETGAFAAMTISGNVTGTGSIDIFAHSALVIDGTVSSGQTVTFEQSNGDGLLILDDSHGFQGTISGLTEASNENLENQVDLKDLLYIPWLTHAYYHNGEVTVSDFFDSVTLKVSGNSSGSYEVSWDGSGGTLLSDPAASGIVTIDSNQTLDIAAASSAAVTFTNTGGNHGELVLDDSTDFTGTIVGFAGDGTTANSDMIDVTGVQIADVAMNKTTYTENANGTGTLTLYDANGHALDSINFTGNYQLANFTIENDGNGGTLIVDPPVNTESQTPGNTHTASNQNSTGTGATDGFAFNFAGSSHPSMGDFHLDHDPLQPGGPALTNLHTGANNIPEPGHWNMAQGLDGQDHLGLSTLVKPHLHNTDFHIV